MQIEITEKQLSVIKYGRRYGSKIHILTGHKVNNRSESCKHTWSRGSIYGEDNSDYPTVECTAHSLCHNHRTWIKMPTSKDGKTFYIDTIDNLTFGRIAGVSLDVDVMDIGNICWLCVRDALKLRMDVMFPEATFEHHQALQRLLFRIYPPTWRSTGY